MRSAVRSRPAAEASRGRPGPAAGTRPGRLASRSGKTAATSSSAPPSGRSTSKSGSLSGQHDPLPAAGASPATRARTRPERGHGHCGPSVPGRRRRMLASRSAATPRVVVVPEPDDVPAEVQQRSSAAGVALGAGRRRRGPGRRRRPRTGGRGEAVDEVRPGVCLGDRSPGRRRAAGSRGLQPGNELASSVRGWSPWPSSPIACSLGLTRRRSAAVRVPPPACSSRSRTRCRSIARGRAGCRS